MNSQIAIHWFRRDLRLEDNTALYQALTNNEQVLPIFIFDTEILETLEDKSDARVQFIFDTLMAIRKKLRASGNDIYIAYGSPLDVFKTLIRQYAISTVYTNHDFEPYAIQRDNAVSQFLQEHNIAFKTFKDQVIFEKDDVLKDDGKPYTIYTPYSKKWKLKLTADDLAPKPSEKYLRYLFQTPPLPEISLQQLGFLPTKIFIPGNQLNLEIVKNYHNTRDLPAVNGTSRMSVHLRFGTVSIRHLARLTQQVNEKYFNELIWREFYQMILAHFPHVVTKSFKPEYDRIVWRNNESEFESWCQGKTGFPIVDAGMRELNATGHMHNRVRMIVSSFLTKDLLIDWRWGEAYFAKKLLDFDLASNNGGWQWAAGCGVDAAPYFRIFNPQSQTLKFDPELKYISHWVPELNELSYPKPIVDHSFARDRVLKVYKAALSR
ncbi:MAG TPA: deoxyribodipyrimidine photo-lyase [Chitinophagales bacterium]|nr:deoxyribodipyrimidine photo-lyase [Chitinophagales bacterium]HRH52120.1 deoxyribodipyrimidine photo-lyase [Chitinophagales bacterium]